MRLTTKEDIQAAFLLLRNTIEQASQDHYDNPEPDMFKILRKEIVDQLNWTYEYFEEQFNCSDWDDDWYNNDIKEIKN